MKKTIICTVVLLGILCACSAQRVPPDLIVQSTGSGEIADIVATMGTYSWSYGGGGVEADAPHPLEMTDIATITDTPEKIKLGFNDDPVGYTVHRWAVGTASEDYDTVETEDDCIVSPEDDKSYIYEVRAEYKRGIVHYTFQINK